MLTPYLFFLLDLITPLSISSLVGDLTNQQPSLLDMSMPFTTSAPILSVFSPLFPRSWFCAVLFFSPRSSHQNFLSFSPHIPLQLAELVTTTTPLGHLRQRRRPLLSLPLVFLAQQQWPLRHSHERSTQATLFVAVFGFFVWFTNHPLCIRQPPATRLGVYRSNPHSTRPTSHVCCCCCCC